ncbi:MAG: 50S ribosomal protein L20 [Oscillospiraceae bacterium]|jgi:large subunit ribosomal protein L20|nr:50S ribosomal protein L20 [Oscillospiraceae bacterium]
MARIKTGILSHKRRKKILKLSKGYYGAKSKQFRTAKQTVMRAGLHAYIGRKNKKRDFRRLWILRISAACKLNNTNYSRFINGLKKSGTELNRKMLSEIAVADPQGFLQLVEKSKTGAQNP